MFISEACVTSGGRLVLETREVKGFRGVLAQAVEELLCTHDGRSCREAFCLIGPPAWTWKTGVGYRLCLGAGLRKIGIWATCSDRKLVESRDISATEAERLWGWEAADLSVARAVFTDFED